MVLAPVAMAGALTSADQQLSGWVRTVLADNPEMQAAQAAVKVASGRSGAAGQPLFNPELEFEYESSDIDRTTGGISQAIDWADKRGARAAVADLELEGALAGLRLQRQELATDLLQALADWHTAVAAERVSEKQATLMTSFARIAEQRRKAGDLSRVELDLAHLAAIDAAFGQANANESLIRARQAVNTMTGSESSGWPPFSRQLPEIDPQQVDMDHLLNELPAMRVARARAAAARAAVQLSVREKRPDPTIGVRVGKENSETLTGVTLSVPLFVRNNFTAEVEVANAMLIQAEREAATVRQQARVDLVATAQLYRNAGRAWKNWEASGAPRLSQRTDLLDRLWQAGELSTTDYLVQLKQTLDTETDAIEQRGRMWRAWAGWLAASGLADQWLNISGDTQ